MRKLAWFGAVLVVVLFGLAFWLSSDRSGGRAPEGETADGSHSYGDVRVFEDEMGTFAGTLSVRNNTDLDSYVVVRVNLYDGDQNVAQMLGDVSLRPNSESSVDVGSTDDFGSYTEARIHLLALPQ